MSSAPSSVSMGDLHPRDSLCLQRLFSFVLFFKYVNLNFVFSVFSYGLWVLISVSAIKCKIETKKSSFKLQKS